MAVPCWTKLLGRPCAAGSASCRPSSPSTASPSATAGPGRGDWGQARRAQGSGEHAGHSPKGTQGGTHSSGTPSQHGPPQGGAASVGGAGLQRARLRRLRARWRWPAAQATRRPAAAPAAAPEAAAALLLHASMACIGESTAIGHCAHGRVRLGVLACWGACAKVLQPVQRPPPCGAACCAATTAMQPPGGPVAAVAAAVRPPAAPRSCERAAALPTHCVACWHPPISRELPDPTRKGGKNLDILAREKFLAQRIAQACASA